MRQLNWPQAIGWRMRRHRLHERSPRGEVLQVATEHGGLHAQVMSSAEWIAWCRVADIREGDVTRLLWQERRLIKTWAMRHTLHLVAAADYWAWIGAASSLRGYIAPTWLRQLGLSSEELEAVIEATGEALSQGPLTRSELAAEVARMTGNPRVEALLQQSWGLLLKPACMKGLLCFSEGEGTGSRFVHPELHLRKKKPARPRTGLKAIARQFFATNGPATEKEFARWLGLDVAGTRQSIAGLADELEMVDLEGTPAWMIAGHAAEARQATPERTVRLLPSFDPYVFAGGLAPERYLRGGHYKQIYKASAWYAPVLFAQGGFAGVWSWKKAGSRLTVTIEPFRSPAGWLKKGAEQEAELLAHSMDRKLELTWSQQGAK